MLGGQRLGPQRFPQAFQGRHIGSMFDHIAAQRIVHVDDLASVDTGDDEGSGEARIGTDIERHNLYYKFHPS
ncbi:hypothetical protein DQ384_15550 [Sphaerisporangium album]|uniref:Uncharacterized protein n=1 Tax=Sphaerisporangium album TaxID=509200 RepID=A0A367FIL4_9ACTN|nr:hypothetical protein DQ384_15550 [Sphaerisporangium album]